jgi:hypothetical protein
LAALRTGATADNSRACAVCSKTVYPLEQVSSISGVFDHDSVG